MQDRMRFHMLIRGVIFLGFAMALFKLLLTGDIINFIAPKMFPFIWLMCGASLLLGCIQLFRSDGAVCLCERHTLPKTTMASLSLYTLFLSPIVLVFVFSTVGLDGRVAAKRGVNLTGEQMIIQDIEEEPFLQISTPPEGYYENLEKKLKQAAMIDVTDDEYISIMDVIGQDVEGFSGKKIRLIGFVHREDELDRNTIIIARHGITCCAADSSVLGMLAVGETSQLSEGQWIQVEGVLSATTYIDTLLPIVNLQSIQTIDAPREQYVYQKF
ncbi:TIGR03943 family protein [Ectobacillus sp. JY-23]|uniref:TIGR03943 family putative permease subunit n=1 Tax=Ectobacillus sp. JY-23 TaxID=2933872 RepID=UPI001FF2AFCA|nr:TIGR03943 family protein [Ectobacillus sp. JY-23]UOY92757.1 TIGR03943 family protein [Ectobacillus sp. JY-23]